MKLVEHYGCMCCSQHRSFGAKDNITVEAYIPASLNYRKQEAKQRHQTSISVTEHKTPIDASTVRFSQNHEEMHRFGLLFPEYTQDVKSWKDRQSTNLSSTEPLVKLNTAEERNGTVVSII